MSNGTLYLIPSFLSETNDKRNFPMVNMEVVFNLEHFIVENLRTARRFLRKVGYSRNFDDVSFYELNKHTPVEEFEGFLNPARKGYGVGMISEAGAPCIADPGAEIVRRAHEAQIRVVPFTGPSSIFLALMASGFNGQSFQFHGYLPIEKKAREKKLRDLEQHAQVHRQTQIFMETPYRNNQLLDSILQQCHEQTSLCIASMITHDSLEYIVTRPIGHWRKNKPDLHKKPSVFLLF